MENKNDNYSASNITFLEGLEHVRKRPGMYIGSTSKSGLHHMVWEIVDNSVDEAMAGFAKNITIKLGKNHEITVIDDGRGIPVDNHPKFGISALEVVLTKLNAGGKFESDAYKVSGGLHGVGASVVNALSQSMKAWVQRDGNVYHAEFHNGGKTKVSTRIVGNSNENETGTIISFIPDFTIMEKMEYDLELINDHAKQIAYLNKSLKVIVEDNRGSNSTTFEYYYENGLVDYIKDITSSSKVLNANPIYANKMHSESNIGVEVAVQYLQDTYQSSIVSYTNNILTIEGGTHLNGFLDATLRILNNYGISKGLIKSDKDKLSKDDIQESVVAIVSIKHPDPQFEGQTKGKLGSKDARKAVNEVYSETFERFLDENPDIAKGIIELAQISRKSRIASNLARENMRKSNGLELSSNVSKLASASSNDPTISELFIVEGNSAGGSAKSGRDRETQAILALRGKILNVEKVRLERAFENEEISTIIRVLGTGFGEEFDINKLKYHKIIIMTDADVDGAHIRTLLLTFFYRYFKPLIENGNVYIAQPPLFKIEQNKKVHYAYDDAQKESIIAENINTDIKYTTSRYKGLGEMNPDQLWETTMNPETRILLQVQIHDAIKADKIFRELMGDNVEPRKKFISENAKFVNDLDI